MELDKDVTIIRILNTIYQEVFPQLKSGVVDVFLCGGASAKSHLTMRDKLKKSLELTGKVRVFYPEELFMDILAVDKSQNLLSIEKLLADNCDAICIVCESVGSFVELGAFTNNSDTFNKVIAMVQTKYKNENSFLMQGPIKYIQSVNKENVLFYNSNIDDTTRQLTGNLRKFKKAREIRALNSITGLYYYLLLMFYFLRAVDVTKAVEYVKNIFELNDFHLSPEEFNFLYLPAVKLLYRGKMLERRKDTYHITREGLNYGRNIVSGIKGKKGYTKQYLCDFIRLQVLECAYY